jgi:hypothetical protein
MALNGDLLWLTVSTSDHGGGLLGVEQITNGIEYCTHSSYYPPDESSNN